ncbi:MAG: N-acetylneuraminate synthase family protein [Candidatus Hydrogenedentota bacterium]
MDQETPHETTPGRPPPPYLVAEIGCNHCGDFALAKELVHTAAAFCQVPAVKFQKRTPAEVLSPKEYDQPHPEPRHSYGGTYGAHREFLEFTLDQHRQLADYCRECGVAYSASVWDLTAAREIMSLAPPFIKVPSACNTWPELTALLCGEFGGDIHVSLGMTAAAEMDAIVARYVQHGRAKDLVLYHCTSGYPIAFEDANLLEIPYLLGQYGDAVKAVGFSGHHKGIAIDVAAHALGATYFERHFTLDRTLKGTDHAASLEPDGLRRLNRDLQAAHLALRRKPRDILPVEEVQRAKLKWDRVR